MTRSRSHWGQVSGLSRSLHFVRISQILKGGPTGRWAKAAREQAAEDT